MVRLSVRILDIYGQLLGWSDLLARMPGDGTLRAAGPLSVLVEQAGTPAIISVHWCDLNVEVRMPPPPGQIREFAVNEIIGVDWGTEPVIRVGMPPENLPCVVVRKDVVVTPPTGGIGAQAGEPLLQ